MPSGELAQAIRLVHRGYSKLEPGLMEKRISSVPDSVLIAPEIVPQELTHLTPREQDVLRLISSGTTNREIAEHLYISEGTVKIHVTHLLNRLNLRNRSQLAIYANSVFRLTVS